MWAHPWGVDSEGIEEGTVVEECLFTYNREMVYEAHAIVFHHTAFSYKYVPQPWPYYRLITVPVIVVLYSRKKSNVFGDARF